MEELIYDRVQSDVINATAKGQYNANDLNRLEDWCKYLQEQIVQRGYTIQYNAPAFAEWLKDWHVKKSEFDRIRENIKNQNEALISIPDFREIQMLNNVDFTHANLLEKNLHLCDTAIKNMDAAMRFSGELIANDYL